jgi:hypothetical protein
MGQMRNVYQTLSDGLKEKNHSEGPNIDGRMILKGHFKGLGSEGVNSIYMAHCID